MLACWMLYYVIIYCIKISFFKKNITASWLLLYTWFCVVHKITWQKSRIRHSNFWLVDVILPYNFSVHVSVTIPINSCTLCINIGIDMQRKKMHIIQKTLSCVINGQQNIPFLSSWRDISLILYYDVTYQLNIQVKYIVQRYQFRAKK